MARSALEWAGDSSTDHPVGMAYLLGGWATDCWAMGRRRLTSSMFDISLPTDRPTTAVAWQCVTRQQSYPLGMALKINVGIHYVRYGQTRPLL